MLFEFWRVHIYLSTDLNQFPDYFHFAAFSLENKGQVLLSKQNIKTLDDIKDAEYAAYKPILKSISFVYTTAHFATIHFYYIALHLKIACCYMCL